MPRTARLIAPGIAHHLTQRGNDGRDVFLTDQHRRQYLLWLAEYAQQYGLRVWAYCLMPNHVHLVAVPQTVDSLSAVMRALQMRHANRLNFEAGTTGHLWQSRFYSCALDDRHLHCAVWYVERNPVRAGLVGDAKDFMWSSARPHCGLRKDPVLSPDLPLLAHVSDWSHWLCGPQDASMLDALRENTMKGKPCGDANFIQRLTRQLVMGTDPVSPLQ